MNIPSSQIKFRPTLSQPAGKAESSNAPAEQQQSQEPTEKYESWVPLANAAVVGGAIALPTAVGALGHQFLGAGLATGLAVSVVPVATAVGVGAWAYNSAKEEFNGHPILTGLTTAVAAGAKTDWRSPLARAAAIWSIASLPETCTTSIGTSTISASEMARCVASRSAIAGRASA